MVKKNKILDFIFYYNIIIYGLLAAAFKLASDLAVDYVYEAASTDRLLRNFEGFGELAIRLAALGLWIAIVFCGTREKVYFKKTRRHYGKDHGMYNRYYHELVDYFKDAEPQKMDIDTLPSKTWEQSSGLIFGKIKDKLISFEPKKNGVVGMIWGAPGDGKTTSTIITSARQFGIKFVNGKRVQKGAVMVTDLKGDIYEANKKFRRIKRFSTIHWKKSYHYDPLVSCRQMDEDSRCTFLDNLAVTLIPNESGSDAVYFINCARAFFTGIFLFLLKENIDMSFPDICLAISTGSYTAWGQKIEESGYEYAMKYTNRFKDENPKNVGGGYSKLCDSLNLYTSNIMKTLLNNDDRCISPDDLENCIDIYVQVDPNEMDTIGGPIIALLYQVFMSKMLHRNEGQTPPIAFIIDEFGQIPAMPVIAKSAALMRAYNCSLLFSCQSLAMIEDHYGDKGRKKLMDCVKVHAFLSIMDPDTRDWASRLIGTRKVLKLTNSISSNQDKTASRSATEAREKCFEPESFGLLPDDDSLIIYYFGHYIKAQKTYYFGKKTS